MTEENRDPGVMTKQHRDVPAERPCIRCGTKFWSEGFGERICRRCKSSASWKSAVPAFDWRSGRR